MAFYWINISYNYYMDCILLKKLLGITIFLLCLLVKVDESYAQSASGDMLELARKDNSDSLPAVFNMGIFPKTEPTGLKKISISGYYRFFATYNRMKEEYVLNEIISDTAIGKQLFIGDDSQLPNLLLNVSGRPSKRVAWAFDIYTFQYLNGQIGQAYSGQVADSLKPSIQSPINGTRLAPNLILNLGINLYGSYLTDYGTFNLRAGGISWYALSDLTMSSFQGYNRFSLFERNPWDPIEKDINGRYSQYYEEGAISQDTRWGNRAFQGIILEGLEMPGKMSFAGLYGKAEINGGFASTPNLAYGGRLKKSLQNTQFIALNTFGSHTYTDSLATEKVGYNIASVEFRKYIENFRLEAEIGAGKYYSPVHNKGWEEALTFKILSPLKKGIPQFELHAFRIDQNVINNVGEFLNSSVNQYQVNDIPAGQVGSNAVLQPQGSSIVSLGMMTNNRQGINLNTSFEQGNLHGAIGLGTAAEIAAISNSISYGNPINRLTRSRFWRFNFPQVVGPYGRYNVIFRDTYQTVNLFDDSSGVAVNRKFFNNLEAQLKYKSKIGGREFYSFFLGQYASVQREWSAFVVTNEEAYIRFYSSELENYYVLSKNLILTSYLGYERILGNYLTDIDEDSRKPRNQQGYGFGLGLDIGLGRNARLYVRHRWYEFEDRSFSSDHFRGEETMVELKATF